MIRILINDGIHPDGQKRLEEAGFEVSNSKVAQDDLMNELPAYNAIVVRSATKVRTDLINNCPNLKVIARGGVGLDNIDVDHAKSKNINVINTPAASSEAVAELAFGHIFSLSRFIHDSNRQMPVSGATEFKVLKKSYSKGSQLRGKTLGVIGCGRIGQETLRIGAALGMKVLAVDPYVEQVDIDLKIIDSDAKVTVKTVDMDTMLAHADFISMHIPFTGKAVLGEAEMEKMKDGVVIVNCARGGTLDENALLGALESGKVAAAGLDVFESEPSPNPKILAHPKISLTPHIGASTLEAQRNIGLELADKIIAHFN